MTQRSPNNSFEEISFPDITDWNAIKWHKVEKYVNNLQKQIYRAVSEIFKQARMFVLTDKPMLEPYVMKMTRTVLRKG